MSTHYSQALCSETSWKLIKQRGEDLKAYCLKWNLDPIIIYSGMSGISYATLLGLWFEQNQVNHYKMYVRKEFEESHGKPIEHSLDMGWSEYRGQVLVFVDDFVEYGITRKRCLTAVFNHFKTAVTKKPPRLHARIYQVLESYSRGESEKFLTVAEFKKIMKE